MWWRAIGVAVVLLCVGVAGGYAVADRMRDEPARTTTAEPVPAVSPAVPTPPQVPVLPDPETDPLATGLPSAPVDLRLGRRSLGVTVNVPLGWQENRPEDTSFWTFAGPDNTRNTYSLRVTIVRGANVSLAVAKANRIAALEDADANGGIAEFTVTAQTGDTFEASYVDGGYFRLTMETFVSFDGSHAYASAAVTGRQVDEVGMRDLLTRTVESMQELPPKGR
jgi:hypothetical protein